MLTRAIAFVRSEDGATSIEYALIATFVAMVIITSVTAVGLDLSNVFTNVAAEF